MSKKLTITLMTMQALVAFGTDAPAEDKFKYACLIAGVSVIYKAIQIVSEYLKTKGN